MGDKSWAEICDEHYPHLKELAKLPITIRVEEHSAGWFCAVYWGDGDQPGSLIYARAGHRTPFDAFAELIKQRDTCMWNEARTEYETPDTSKYAKEV